MSFKNAVSMLKAISKRWSKVSKGNMLFQDLKITIADGESMGVGNDHSLAYFYCTNNIDHFLNL